PRARAFAAAQREGLCAVVPAHDDLFKVAALTGKARSIVVVESEGPVGSRIDRQRQRLARRLFGVLLDGPCGHDRSSPNEQRHGVEWGIDGHAAAAFDPLRCPEIPPRALWECQLARRCSILEHRCGKKVRPEEEGVDRCPGFLVLRKCEAKTADDGEAGGVRLVHRGIEIGKQTIASLEELAADGFDRSIVQVLFPGKKRSRVRPHLRRAIAACIPTPGPAQLPVAAVAAKGRTECTKLEPAEEEFGGELARGYKAADIRAPERDAIQSGVDAL